MNSLINGPGVRPLLEQVADDPAPRPIGARLFEAVRTTLNDLAATRPLLVVIEDVHWADRSSLELISYLLARPFPAPVSIIISYRTDDLHRRHPLRPVAAGLAPAAVGRAARARSAARRRDPRARRQPAAPA